MYTYANKYHIKQYISKSKMDSINGITFYNHMAECLVSFLMRVPLNKPNFAMLLAMAHYIFTELIQFYNEGNGGPVSLTIGHVLSSFYHY